MKNQYESEALSHALNHTLTHTHTHTCKLVGNIDFICKKRTAREKERDGQSIAQIRKYSSKSI